MRTLLLALLLLAAAFAGCAADPKAPPSPTPAASTPDLVALREDTEEFTLPPRGSIEWKLRLAEGETLEYDWSATRAVYFDFHGDYDDGTEDFVSHKEGTLASDAGAQTIAFTGRHGWYFQNQNAQPITITLHTKGAYEVVGKTGGTVDP